MSFKKFVKRGFEYIITGKPNINLAAEISYRNPSGLLKGRRILITGGGRGLGYSMAQKFVAEGGIVTISGRNADTLRKSAQEIGCEYIVMDMLDISSFPTLLGQASNKMGGVDCLVNNAGVSFHEGNIMNVTPEQFDLQFGTNLRGSYFLTKEFISQTNDANIKRNILFVSSERGFLADDLPYGLTKVAINSLVKGLAFRFLKNGIRVNGIAPGVTSSDMTGVAKDGNLYYPYNSNDRAYLPEEVAEVATFLLSDVSGCISGEIIQCNEAKTVNAHWR